MATPVIDGQVSINGLLMGRDTPYRLLGFNPWTRTVRHEQSDRAWAGGSWSGREFAEATTVPLRIRVEGTSAGTWLSLHQALTAAMRPTQDDVELRWRIGGVEYVMFGRPRMVEPDVRWLGVGQINTRAAFVGLDPLIYAGTETIVMLGLPQFSGGLTVPFTVPFTVTGVLVDGSADLVNAGKADTSLLLRIDGPVSQPRVALTRPDGQVQTLFTTVDLVAGQWLTIDTGAHTVLLQDVANRRGQVSGQFPILPPGTSTLRFAAADFHPDAELTVTFRSAWW